MAFSLLRSLPLIVAACLLAHPADARRKPVRLPQSAPVPELLAERLAPPEDTEEAAAPPETAPVPEAKPHDADTEKSEEAKPPSPQPDPRSKIVAAEKMPAEEEACRERLRALNVEFDDKPAKRDTEVGCSIPYPLKVTKLGKTVELAPEAEMNCAMAETVARFAADVIQPAAKDMGVELAGIGHASAYVCRPRHNGAKLSEHAFGNALDIASFTFKDGSRIEVGPKPGEKQGRFLDRVRKAACGPFKTVLGPGSDPDHETHLHLDLAPRRNGSTFCQ